MLVQMYYFNPHNLISQARFPTQTYICVYYLKVIYCMALTNERDLILADLYSYKSVDEFLCIIYVLLRFLSGKETVLKINAGNSL